MSLTIKCVDLFCGCGGMSLGFEASGFNIVAGIDNWKAAIRVYEKISTIQLSKRILWM